MSKKGYVDHSQDKAKSTGAHSKADNVVVQDEKDAEKRYLDSVRLAQVRAVEWARIDSDNMRRAATEQAAEALRRVESARLAAASQPTPEEVKTTFMQDLSKWWSGV